MNWNNIPDDWKEVLIYLALAIILIIAIFLIFLQAMLNEDSILLTQSAPHANAAPIIFINLINDLAI